MAVHVVVGATVEVTPGQEVELSLAVTNVGSVVDSVTLSVLGEAERWATVVPPSLTLFPGGTGEATVQLVPPCEGGPVAGPLTVGVLARSAETGVNTVVECDLVIARVVALEVGLVPETSYGRRGASHTVLVRNLGNVTVPVTVRATDPDQLLQIELDRSSALIGPSEQAGFDVRLRFMGVRDAPYAAFSVTATTPGGDPSSVRGTFVQRRRRIKLPIVLLAATLALVAVVTLRSGRDSTALLGSVSDDGSVVTTGTGSPDSLPDSVPAVDSTTLPTIGGPAGAVGKIPVPDLVNLPAPEAINRLTAAGLKATNLSEANAAVPAGFVIRSEPPVGAMLNPGDTVTLFVSAGAATTIRRVAVPNVIGSDEATARSRMSGAGLNVQVEVTPGGTPGRVKGQNPAGGAQIAPGAIVVVVIGSATSTTTVSGTTTVVRSTTSTSFYI